MAESSTVARWELALRIKKRRDELGIKADQIARELGFTRNFFSAVENERAMLATEKLELLMEMLRLDNVERAEFRELDRIARTRGWWESEEGVLGEAGSRFIGLEQGATEIRTFGSLVIAGFLQTPEYSSAVLNRDPLVGRIQMREIVRIRSERQRRLLESDTQLKVLMSEAAALQVWAEPAMQATQLRQIVDHIDRLEIEIRLLPFGKPPGPIAQASALYILDFASLELPSIVYQEPLGSMDFIEAGTGPYERIRISWEEGYENALSLNETRDKLVEIAAQFEGS